MKKYILTLILTVLIAGCGEQACRPTAWFLAGPDVDGSDELFVGRAGLRSPGGSEFGIESQYIGVGEQSYGAYALVETQIVDIGTQYIGGHASIIDTDTDGAQYGLISGIIVKAGENADIVTEYQFNALQDNLAEIRGTDDEHVITAGLRIRF